jgi:hypothetical protein
MKMIFSKQKSDHGKLFIVIEKYFLNIDCKLTGIASEN